MRTATADGPAGSRTAPAGGGGAGVVAAWPQPRSKVSKITGSSLGGRAAAVLHAGGRSSGSGWRRECSTGAPSGPRAGGLGKRAPARRLARRLQKRLQHEEAAPEQASGRGAVRGQYYCESGRAGALKKPQEVVVGLESAHRHGGWPSRVKNSSSRRRRCRSGRCLAAAAIQGQ